MKHRKLKYSYIYNKDESRIKINNPKISVHLIEVYKETCMDVVTDHVRHFILT
jgi:hypothetical protein